MTTLEQYALATEEYLTRLRFRNLQATTMRNYETTLRLFGDFLRESAIADLYEAVELWKESMLRSGNKPSTVNQRLTTLKIFFGKATKRSFPSDLRFSENPVDTDENIKEPKRPYEEILTDDQVKLLYRNDPYHGARLWARTYAIVNIFLNEKIRNAELLDLTLADIDFEHHEITVQNGKGRKFRVVDMCPLTETAIMLYLDSEIRPICSDDAPLFGTTAAHEFGATANEESWHRGTTQWVSNLVEHHVREICGVANVRSHDLRHIGSRVCLNAGTSLEELQGQLGHSSMNTTQIYSSRLLARRRRESAQSVFAARDEEARRNKAILDARQIGITLRKQA